MMKWTVVLGLLLHVVAARADSGKFGPYLQLDVFAPDGASSLTHAQQAGGIDAKFSPAQGWNTEIRGVPFKWANRTQNLLGDNNGAQAKGDTLVFKFDQPRRATHVEMLVTAVFGHASLRGKTMGQVEVTYEDGSVDTLDLVLGKNIRNNHFYLPTDPQMKTPKAAAFNFVSDTTDTKHVCEMVSDWIPHGDVRFAIDRVKLPLPDEALRKHKRVKQLLIRNLPHPTLDPGVATTGVPVVQQASYSGLQIWAVTLGREVPMIVVPGILGTEIASDQSGSMTSARWPMALGSGTASSLALLGFHADGSPMGAAFSECRVLGQASWHVGPLDAYGGLIQFLQDQVGYKLANNEAKPDNGVCWVMPTAQIANNDRNCERQDLYTLPYDWRQSPRIAAGKLRELVQRIKSRTGADKVDIAAHSLGGIVSRIFLSTGGADDVDDYITMGTPFLGSPAVFSMLRFGDVEAQTLVDIAGVGAEAVQREGLKRLGQNLWGLYTLLPSKRYVDVAGSYYTYDGTDIKDGSGAALTGALDYGKMSSWLGVAPCRSDWFFPAGSCATPDAPLYNSALVAFARDLHAGIDTWDASGDGAPKMYAIIGSGLNTLGSIHESASPRGDGTYARQAVFSSCTNGDSQVAIKSAEGHPASAKRYYVKGEHSKLPAEPAVQNQIQRLVTGMETNAGGVQSDAFSVPSGMCSLSR